MASMVMSIHPEEFFPAPALPLITNSLKRILTAARELTFSMCVFLYVTYATSMKEQKWSLETMLVHVM